MKTFTLPGVTSEFLHAFLQYYELTERDIKPEVRNNQNRIGNARLQQKIIKLNELFKTSEKSIGQFFRRTVVMANKLRNKEEYLIQSDIIDGKPLFMVTDGNIRYKHGFNVQTLTAKKPIKMAPKHIFNLY